jgi:hypothetical protein
MISSGNRTPYSTVAIRNIFFLFFLFSAVHSYEKKTMLLNDQLDKFG